MDISIKSGGKEIIGSGIFTSFNETPSTISVKKNSEGFNIKVILKKGGSSNPALNILSEKDSKKNDVNITVELINFNTGFFSGFVEPIAIGTFDNGDKVYLQLNARKIGNNLERHDISYTIYLEKKDEDK